MRKIERNRHFLRRCCYEGLKTIVGQGHISRFLDSLARPYVLESDLELAYQEIAQDENREEEE